MNQGSTDFVAVANDTSLIRLSHQASSVSVVVTTCDRPESVQRALRTVVAQGAIREVIVADDSSDELQPEVCAALSKWENVRYIRVGARVGASAARNRGWSEATGSYVAFLDDDDWWLDGYISRVLAKANRLDLDVVLTGFLEFRNGRLLPEKQPTPGLTATDFLLHNPGLRGSNLFVRKERLDQLGGFDESLPCMNDMDLGYRLLRLDGLRYAPLDEHLVVFNNHSEERLSSAGGRAKALGLHRFLAKYRNQMDDATAAAYVRKARNFWKVELKQGPSV